MIQRAKGSVARRQSLPEYLEKDEVDGLIRCALNSQGRLLMLIQWRAGLRVSEALALEVGNLQLDGERSTLRVRYGKGSRSRLVPVHSELRAALVNALAYGGVKRGRIIQASRATVWRWLKEALSRAEELG